MTLSFLCSAILDAAKKTVRAWRFAVAVMLFSLVIVAGCDVRPFSEFNGDDNGSEENGDDTGSEGTSGDETDGDETDGDETDGDETDGGDDDEIPPLSMRRSIASGDESDGDDDEEVPDDTTRLRLIATPTAIETTVNAEQTIDIDVVNPEVGRTYTYIITTNPTNGTSDMNKDTGVLTYISNIATEGDSLEVTVADDGEPRRSNTIEIDITVNPN
jgi:hypothetical protein